MGSSTKVPIKLHVAKAITKALMEILKCFNLMNANKRRVLREKLNRNMMTQIIAIICNLSQGTGDSINFFTVL
jgi:hypothetical protein